MKKFVEISKEEYRRYCREKNIDWLQSIEFSKLRERLGARCYFVSLKDGKKNEISGLIFSKNKRFDLVMINSEGISEEIFVDFLVSSERFANEKGAISYRILPKVVRTVRDNKLNTLEEDDLRWLNDPLLKTGFRYYSGFKYEFDMDVNMHVYIKDLAKLSKDDVAATYNQTVRRNLKFAEKKGLSICEIEECDFADFVAILESSNLKNGISTRSEKYYHDLKACFGDRARFVGVKFEGRIISAGVFIFFGDEVVYFEGGSLQEYRKIPASTFLQDFMIKEAIDAGVALYNFYGITANYQDSLLRFKSGFRGKSIEYAGEYRKRYLIRAMLNKIFRK